MDTSHFVINTIEHPTTVYNSASIYAIFKH